MRSPYRIRPWRWSLPTVLLTLCLGCGVGPVKETSFVYGTVGPEGGVLKAGNLELTVPPGAFTEPTAVAVVPETTVLPILAGPGDPATYTLAGGQWCCGPQGLAPLKVCQLRVKNAGGGGAPKQGPSELVLLLWDAERGALVPAGSAAAYDPGEDQFDVAEYGVFGHVAIGIRQLPYVNPGFAFTAYALRSEPPNRTEPGDFEEGLYVASVDGSLPLKQLPTEEVLPQTFIPAPEGDRILYEFEPRKYTIAQSMHELFTVGLEDTAPTLVAGLDPLVEGYDPTFGWMHDSPTVFFQSVPLTDPDGDDGDYSDTPFDLSFTTVPGDASSPATLLYDVAEYAWVEDVRQSPDGALVLIRYWGGQEEELIDVFEASTGLEVSRGVIPRGGTWVTPRFLPNGSGVYLVDEDQATVVRFDPDGTNEGPLFTPPPEHGYLRDFVLAPNGDDYAYVTHVSADLSDVQSHLPASIAPGNDALHVGSLSGGVRASVPLGRYAYYQDLEFHPNGKSVFVDTDEDDVRIFAAADAVEGPELHVEGLGMLDVNRDDGRLLLTVFQLFGEVPLEPVVPPQLDPGVYVAEPDGSGMQPVVLPAELDVLAARWLRTIRRAPCMGRVDLFR